MFLFFSSFFFLKYSRPSAEFGFENKSQELGVGRGGGMVVTPPCQHGHQVLDSLGGRSSLVSDVTMETGLSEVVLLMVLEIWPMRSSTQPADRRASASWSQHSSMVSHIWLKPCRKTKGCYISDLLISIFVLFCFCFAKPVCSFSDFIYIISEFVSYCNMGSYSKSSSG